MLATIFAISFGVVQRLVGTADTWVDVPFFRGANRAANADGDIDILIIVCELGVGDYFA